ncbi:MAG TPA: hypothetical protein VK157_14450 [Phycisphaerales bacterium]|nr:hypothetical protein [Phycisphaerales bacterium]
MHKHASILLLASVCGLPMAACQSTALRRDVAIMADRGEYGRAAGLLQQDVTSDMSNKDYLLTRMRLLLMALADGQPDAAEETANQLFSLLRTQGVNEDRTVASVVFYEGVRIWKGEPFEQALGFHYVAMQKALRGEWDNARAASSSSLFLLRDFANAVGKPEPTTLEVAEAAAKADASKPGQGDALIDNGYVTSQSDFALGYLMNAAANIAVARQEEASDNLTAAVRANAALKDIAETMRSGAFNTLLIIDAGRGPAKVATGNDGAIAEWKARTPSDDRRVQVSVNGESAGAFPLAQDINAMARSHRWRNLEDVRTIKSAIGDGLIIGGGAVLLGSDSKNNDAKWVGAGLIALGALLKAGSVADTRHAELLPQRVYVVPLTLGEGSHTLRIGIEGSSRAGLTLVNVPGTKSLSEGGQRVRLVYAKLAPSEAVGTWETATSVAVANDAWKERIDGDNLPYIFGGACVRTPTPAVLDQYHAAGHLVNMTPVDLMNLYRAEGITFTVEEQQGRFVTHVLEGGSSMVASKPGSSGYQRLFTQRRGRYTPRSDELKAAIERENTQAQGREGTK